MAKMLDGMGWIACACASTPRLSAGKIDEDLQPKIISKVGDNMSRTTRYTF